MPLTDWSDLTHDPKNPNQHSQRGRGMLQRSLESLGAGRSIVVDRNGTILAGNAVAEVAMDLNLPVEFVHTSGDRIVAVVRDDLDLDAGDDTAIRARDLTIADNRVGELNLTWSAEALAAFAEDGSAHVDAWFTADELAKVFDAEPSFGPVSIDEQGRLDETKQHTCPECGHVF